jgi:lambda repressor-like predicted transcriptional regulator
MTRKVTRPHKKTGRKPVSPKSAVARIAALAATNHSLVGIARELGVSINTLKRMLDESEELSDALAQGKEAERRTLHNGLLRQAKRGNVVAAIFILKTKHGYRENDQADSANKVSITFQLPAAMNPEDFAKVIEHETASTNKPVPAARIART